MAYSLSAVAKLAVNYVDSTQRHIFLTGKAGSGKTTLLKYITGHTYKNLVVAAPTGIAAINAEGVTLHSLLQLPFGTYIPEDIPLQGYDLEENVNTPRSVLSHLKINTNKQNLLRELELLVIDEVSMLRADLLDCIDLILRHVRRRKHEPFGGLQLLFIGDLNQLPPVVKNAEWPLLSRFYKSAYFFEAHALRESSPIFIELDKIYRQSDAAFLTILNRLRDNELIDDDIINLNQYYKKEFIPAPDEGFIHITTHNRKAEITNKKELEKIEATPFKYRAKISGEFMEHMFPLPETLTFKKSSQVMFIKNDTEGQFYNGKIGHIKSLTPDKIEVQLTETEDIVEVEPYVWENKRYKLNPDTNTIEETVVGSFEQYPLKLAWAITVHKSQGLTFEKAILDLSDSFAPGQMYVALSRLTSMDGLVLSSPIPSTDFERDSALSDFTDGKKELDTLNRELAVDRKKFLINYIQKAFNFSLLIREMNDHLNSFTKDESRSVKQKYVKWTKELLSETKPLQEIGNKFIRQVNKISHDEGDNYLKPLNKRIAKAQNYFVPLIQALSDKITSHKNTVGKQRQMKTYAKELKTLESIYNRQKLQILKTQLLIAHAADNKVLTKADLQNSTDYKGKEEDKKAKEEKIPTRQITFDLYRKGHTIEEIAEQRGLVPSTIEGHLSTFVANGEIRITDLIAEKKLQQIFTVARTLDTPLYGAIKAKLGDEFTYGEIKMAMAHQQAFEQSD